MSKTYIVNTKIDIVTVQADSAIEAIKMVAEGRKIKNFDGKLTIRKSYENLYWVRRVPRESARECWKVTEVAEVVTVEVPVIAEVVAEQVEANTEAGVVVIDIVGGATVEVTAEQFTVEALARNADAKFLARKYSDRIAKAAGATMTDEVKLRIAKAVNAVVAKYDEALYA